jgi:hypothetical protein
MSSDIAPFKRDGLRSFLPRFDFQSERLVFVAANGHFRVRRAGGANRDRTDDLRLAKPALSQLSYDPILQPPIEGLGWA